MVLFYTACISIAIALIAVAWWFLRDYRRQRAKTKELEQRLKQYRGLHIEDGKTDQS